MKGHAELRNWLLYSGLGQLPLPIPGVLVLTGNSVVFQQWDGNAERYDAIKRIPFTDVLEVSLDSYGLSRRLVVRKNDLSFDSFDFTKAGNTLVDGAKVEAAVELLLPHFSVSKDP